MKRGLFLALTVILVCMFTSTILGAPQPVKLKIYTQYSILDEKLAYDYAVAAMKKIMPEVTLDLEVAAQDDDQKIKTYAATGNLPDIFFASAGLIEVFKKSNNVLPLDEYVRELKIEEKLLPSARNMLWDKDGHCYGVPNVGQWAALIFYNKKVFSANNIKVPTNYDEFLAAVKALKAKGIIPLALFAKEKWPGVQLYDVLVTRMDPGGLKKVNDGKGSITEPAYRKAAERLVELVKAGLISPAAFNTNYDEACALFIEGKAAMLLNGAWAMTLLGEKMGDNVDFMYYPLADPANAEAVKWNMSGGGLNQAFCVSPHSKYKDIAARFVCQFALKFAEGRVVKCGDPNPILKDCPPPEKGYLPIQQRYVNDSVNFKTMTCFPWGLTDAKFKTAIEDNVQKLLTGEYPVDDFIKDTERALAK